MSDGLSRRGFLTGAAAAASWAVVAGCSSDKRPRAASGSSASATGSQASTLPDPASAPFDTVVVLMMENRSFDHLLGWMPGVNGKQAGLSFPNAQGQLVPTTFLGDDVQGCTLKDPAHDWQAMVTHFNGGACDGWMKTQTTGDPFPVGYYSQAQVPILAALASSYTVFDNYFCSLGAATWPNRLYQLCAATDLDETDFFPGPDQARPSKLDVAIFDRLKGKGLTGGYYTWGEPMTGLFASKRYDDITHPKDQFFTDAAAGRLPNVTFIDPDYTTISEFLGTSNDYHPHGSILAGEGYVAEVYNAMKASPQWDRTVFVLNFDESGGFYDHVPPPIVKDDNVNPNPGPHPDYSRLGFRVPAIAMGPFAPKKIETAGPYEHCSVLKMIEWRWGLDPMSARDANARNLADALDFSQHRAAVELPAFTPPPNTACPNPSIELA
jgi:phospholipase C